MDEATTKDLIQKELRSTGGVVPRHIHNGSDSPKLKFTELEDITDASYTEKGVVEFLTNAATSGITVSAGIANVNTGTSANQIVKLDSSAKLPAVDGSQLTNLPSADNLVHTISGGAAQALTANDALYVGVPTTETISISSTNNADQSILYEGETFVAHGVQITEISWLYLDNNNASATLSIYRTSGGFPTGSALFTYNFTTGNSGSVLTQTRTISGNVETTPGEVLCAVITKNAGGGWGMRTNSSVYAEGNLVTSTDGSSWIDVPGKELCIVSVKSLSAAVGAVAKSNAAYNAQGTVNFIGFAKTTVAKDAAALVVTSGVLGGFSGLTTGSTYYLTDGWGTIGTSAGTTSKKVGKAISATELLIINDN